MEPTIFGISNFKAIEYPQGTTVEDVAHNHDYTIKRVRIESYNGNWAFSYIIFDRKCDPCSIIRNGWILKNTTSYSKWNPSNIIVEFIDRLLKPKV